MIDRRVSIAPMMDYTDRHFRYFMRLFSKHTVLYTEMVTTGGIIHGDRRRFLEFNENEHPLAIQLGGNDPADLAGCARIAESAGYDEVNLNIGCPSDRVKKGRFGACLMTNPALVAECIDHIRTAVKIPVTVKTRLGVDDQDSYDFLRRFIQVVQDAGCNTFILHARKAFLKGLNPKENRTIPPLRYDCVYQIKRDFPHLHITINGGIVNLDQVQRHLQQVDGVMLGRVACQNPYMLAELDRRFFDRTAHVPTRREILERYRIYAEQQIKSGIKPNRLTRHLIGLHQGQSGARQYRRLLSDGANRNRGDMNYLDDALKLVSL